MRVVLLLALVLTGCANNRGAQPVNWSQNYYDDFTTGGIAPSVPSDTDGSTLIVNKGKVVVP
jgi:hypothetical protein